MLNFVIELLSKVEIIHEGVTVIEYHLFNWQQPQGSAASFM